MNTVGPGDNSVRGFYTRRNGSTERVVDRRTFLFGRWKHRERELGGRIDLKNDGRHRTGRSNEAENRVSLEVKCASSLERTLLKIWSADKRKLGDVKRNGE
jgi:hypothetical protein